MPRSANEWREIVRALRAKADDEVTPKPEADALREKAAELETKYCKSNSPPTDDTTVTNRGRGILNFLKENQYQWNDRYYDKDGKPKPGYGGEEDIVEDAYQEAPDEDYGYDIKEGDDW